jgi:hypothetical protein
MSDTMKQGFETLSDEELAAIEADLDAMPSIECDGEIEPVPVGYEAPYAYTDQWSCTKCGATGSYAYDTIHFTSRYEEVARTLLAEVRALKQELPLVLEHLARLPYGPPFPDRNTPEFHHRQGWDSACAFMYSELF